jgi:hypothetical protein
MVVAKELDLNAVAKALVPAGPGLFPAHVDGPGFNFQELTQSCV